MLSILPLLHFTMSDMENHPPQQHRIRPADNLMKSLESLAIEPNDKTAGRGLRFWLVFFSLFIAVFLVCLEAVSTSILSRK